MGQSVNRNKKLQIRQKKIGMFFTRLRSCAVGKALNRKGLGRERVEKRNKRDSPTRYKQQACNYYVHLQIFGSFISTTAIRYERQNVLKKQD